MESTHGDLPQFADVDQIQYQMEHTHLPQSSEADQIQSPLHTEATEQPDVEPEAPRLDQQVPRMCISKAQFKQLVMEIFRDVTEKFGSENQNEDRVKISQRAIVILQEAAEQYLIDWFSNLSSGAPRQIRDENMQMVPDLRDALRLGLDARARGI